MKSAQSDTNFIQQKISNQIINHHMKTKRCNKGNESISRCQSNTCQTLSGSLTTHCTQCDNVVTWFVLTEQLWRSVTLYLLCYITGGCGHEHHRLVQLFVLPYFPVLHHDMFVGDVEDKQCLQHHPQTSSFLLLTLLSPDHSGGSWESSDWACSVEQLLCGLSAWSSRGDGRRTWRHRAGSSEGPQLKPVHSLSYFFWLLLGFY